MTLNEKIYSLESRISKLEKELKEVLEKLSRININMYNTSRY